MTSETDENRNNEKIAKPSDEKRLRNNGNMKRKFNATNANRLRFVIYVLILSADVST